MTEQELREKIKEACNASHAVGFRDGVIKGREGYVKLADIIKDIENSNHPMNTNMYGISLSRGEWESIKSKYSK